MTNSEMNEIVKRVVAAIRTDDCVKTEEDLKKEGWRKCAVGQRSTQFCSVADLYAQLIRDAAKVLIEVMPMPNVEHEADAHNEIVKRIRTAAKQNNYE